MKNIKVHTGLATTDIHEAVARREVGLPEDIQLVYYPRPRDAESKVNIIEWAVIRKCDTYTVLSILSEIGERYNVHSGIVAYMNRDVYEVRNCD